jgi:hypothetical protein
MADHGNDPTAAVIADVLRLACESDPVKAASLGREDYAGILPGLGSDARAAVERQEDSLLARVERAAASPGAGTAPDDAPETALDLACCRAYLRAQHALRSWQPLRRYPQRYLVPALTGLQVLINTKDVERLVPFLRALPDLLAIGRNQLDPELACPDVVRRAVPQARAGAGTLRGLPAALSKAEHLADLAGVAAGALDEFADFADGLSRRATGSFRLGASVYSTLLRERDGIDRSISDLAAAAEQELAACRRELAALPGADKLERMAPADEKDILRRYGALTERARRFCAEAELVPLGRDERCEVVPAPDHRRAVLAVPLYFPPAVLGTSGRQLTGQFQLPYPPEGMSAAGARRLLAANTLEGFATRTVHETYPGHHWHFTSASVSGPHAVRLLCGSPAYLEGWATYAEQAADRAGFFSPAERVGYLEARAFRSVRMLVDIGLHTEEMPDIAAMELLVAKGRQHEDIAVLELARYKTSPTDAISYMAGALEIAQLRALFTEQQDMPLRRFHGLLGSLGAPPLTAARDYLHARAHARPADSRATSDERDPGGI